MSKPTTSKRYSSIPGDQRRVMTRATKDVTGKVWPIGTVYTGLSSGFDGRVGCIVSTIVIRGEKVEVAS